jgi:hypothetical protein
MHSWTTTGVRARREAEDEYLATVRADDLIEHDVRPFIANHPEDFPMSVEDL